MKHFLKLSFAVVLICLSNFLLAQCFSEQSYTTPGEYTYIVPGATSESFTIEIEARGADGGDFLWGGNPQSDGGEGATMGASFTVNGGDELFIIVGESGFDAFGSPGGGGGGGGSAVIINSADVLIAAAAGGGGGQLQVGFGAGASTNSNAAGGAGPGTSGGGGFNEDGEDGLGGSGGGAGTLTSQGSGGSQGVVAGPGGDGFGGGGGGSGTVGGGGGGYQGGDGADGSGSNYGGMGGDSYISTLYGSNVMTTISGGNGDGNNVDGNVTITCIPTGSVEIALISQSDPLCANENSGSIEVTGLGGTLPYTYTIDNGPEQDNGLFENLSAGTYTLTVFDAMGNSAWNDFTISDPAAVNISVINVMSASCFGGSDGSIEIEGSGGTSSSGFYMYGIDGGALQSSGLFEGLSAGSYNMVVHDDNGCTIDMTVEVNDQPEIVTIITNQTDASCTEATNGTVSFSSSGGQGGFSYSLDGLNFQTPATFSNLEQGDYTVTVQDSDGCTATLEFSIGVADPFVFLILDTTNSNCSAADGTVNMIATGGIGGFTYAIDGGTNQMSGNFVGLVSGTYTATATDGAGCTQDLEFTIGMDNNVDIFSQTTDPTCEGGNDGSITLTLDEDDGPYTIVWTGEGVVQNETNQTNLEEGLYSATVTNGDGCSITADFELQTGTTLLVDGSDVQNANCNNTSDGSVTVTVSGGEAPYAYSLNGISNGTGEFDGLSAGIYQIDVEDSNGCTGQVIITIGEPLAISLDIIDQTEAGCDGDTSGSVTIGATNTVGAVSYELAGITNETGIFTGLAGGSYSCTVTDANGCGAAIDVIILQNSTLSGTLTASTNVTCAGGNNGSATVEGIDGSGSYTYSLDGGPSQDNGTFAFLSAGEYEVTISDTEACSFIVSFTISESSALAFVVDETIDVTCNGLADGSVTFHIEGGTAPYVLVSDGDVLDVLDNDPITFEGVEPDTYQVIITDANGCVVESSVTVSQPESIELVIDYLTNVSCNGAEDGTFGFSIEGGTAPFLLTSLGDGSELEIQENEIIERDNSTAFEAEWLITDANGCSINYLFTLTEPAQLEFVINEQQPASCFDVSDAYISFQIEGGTAPYQIITDEGDIMIIENNEAMESNEAEAGIYNLTIIDANECSIMTTVTITQPDELIIDQISLEHDDGSGNGSITVSAFGGTGTYTYSLNNEDFQTNPTFNDLVEGEYSVTVMDENGCMSTETISIVLSDISEIDSDILNVEIMPNPASDYFTIHMDAIESLDLNINMTDISGKLVMNMNSKITRGASTITIDVADIQAGIYFLNLATEKGHITKKIIVQR